MNPRRLAHGDLVTASFAEIQPLLTKALQSERAKNNDDLNEIAVAAQGMAQATELLAAQYSFVVTNVPYLARSKQGLTLHEFSKNHADDAKADLATVFVRRCLEFAYEGGSTALVTPQNWLFLGSYQKLRERLLKAIQWEWVVRLGTGAFETISGEVVNVAMLTLTNWIPRENHSLWGCDASAFKLAPEKAALIRAGQPKFASQADQLRNPDARIALDEAARGTLLEKYAFCVQGLATSDDPQFVLCFWEQRRINQAWEPLLGTVEQPIEYGARERILHWEDGQGRYYEHAMKLKTVGRLGGWKSGAEARGRKGVSVRQMNHLPCTLYGGEFFDHNAAVIVPHDLSHLTAIWAFCRSAEYNVAVRRIDQKMMVTNATLVKVPFDLAHWQRVAEEKYPHGLPEPASDDPTQWLFTGHPLDSTGPLQVGVVRLLGYRWPRQTGQTVSGAAPVPEDGLEKFVDEDGIVCIPSVRGEQPAADRLRELLIKSYGRRWSPACQDELLSAVHYEGCTLEDWLRNRFFDQHCKLFNNRPFIWQIWDGRKDGFSALVNYHKLDYKLLEKLTYTYLGEWIKKQQDAVANEESGADDRLLKAQQLQDKLKLILEGEAPYDIFVRWKPLEQQPIGWHPDLNDGVRLNIRPFMEADVLRKRPNIKWGVDRGKNPPGSPWGEERDNDRHLTLAEKQKARKK